MKKKYLCKAAAGLLAVAALMGTPVAAQNTPKGKVSASLLGLTKTGARSLAQQSATDSPLQATDDVQV